MRRHHAVGRHVTSVIDQSVSVVRSTEEHTDYCSQVVLAHVDSRATHVLAVRDVVEEILYEHEPDEQGAS